MSCALAKSRKELGLDPALSDDKGLLKDGYSYGGFHLTDKGFQVWADAVDPILNK